MSGTHYYRVYEAKDGWRWQEITSSDETSESGEAYSDKANAVAQAEVHAPEGVEVRIEDGDGE